MSTLIMRGHYDSPPYGPGGGAPPPMPRVRSNSDLAAGPLLHHGGGRRSMPGVGAAAPYGAPPPIPGVGGPYVVGGHPPMHHHHHASHPRQHHSPPYGAAIAGPPAGPGGAYPPPGVYPPSHQRYDMVGVGGHQYAPPMAMGPGGVAMPLPLIDLNGGIPPGPGGSGGPNSLRRPTRRRRRSRQSTDVKRTKRENKRSIMLVGLTPEQCGDDDAIKNLVKQFGDVQLIERLDDNRCYVRFDSYPQALDALDAGVCGNGILIKSKHDHLKQLGVTTAETAEITTATTSDVTATATTITEKPSLSSVKEEEEEVEGQVVGAESTTTAAAKEDTTDASSEEEATPSGDDKKADVATAAEAGEGTEKADADGDAKANDAVTAATKEEAEGTPTAETKAEAGEEKESEGAVAKQAASPSAKENAAAVAATTTTTVPGSKAKKIVPSQTKSASATLMAERRASQAAANAQAAAAATHQANGGIPSRRPLVPSLSLDGRHQSHHALRMGSRSQSLAPGALGMPPHPHVHPHAHRHHGGQGTFPGKARNSRRHSEALHFDAMRGRSSSNPSTVRRGPAEGLSGATAGTFYPHSRKHSENPYLYQDNPSLSPPMSFHDRHTLSPEGPTGLISPTSYGMLDRGYDFPPHMHRSRTLPSASRESDLKKKLNVVKASDAPKSEAAVEMRRAVKAALEMPDTPKKTTTKADEKKTNVEKDEAKKADAATESGKKEQSESSKATEKDAGEKSGEDAAAAAADAVATDEKTAVERWIVHEGERSKRAAQFRAEFESKFDGEKRFDRNRRSEIAHKQRAEVYGDLAIVPPLSPPSPHDLPRKRLPYDYYADAAYYHPLSPPHLPAMPPPTDFDAAAAYAKRRDPKYFMRGRSQSLAPHMDIGANVRRERSGSAGRMPQVNATKEELAKAKARGISAASYLRNKAKFIALRSEQLKREYAAARQHAPPLVSPRHYEAAAASPRHIDPVKMFALKSGESIGIIDEAPPRARSQSLTAEYFWRQQRGHTMPGPREKGIPARGILSRVRSVDTIGLGGGGELPLDLLQRVRAGSLQGPIATVPEEGEDTFKLVPCDSPQNAKAKPHKKAAAAAPKQAAKARGVANDISPKQAKLTKTPTVNVHADNAEGAGSKRPPQVSPRYVPVAKGGAGAAKANVSPPMGATYRKMSAAHAAAHANGDKGGVQRPRSSSSHHVLQQRATGKDATSPPKVAAAKQTVDKVSPSTTKPTTSQANKRNSLKRKTSVQGLAKGTAGAAAGGEDKNPSTGKDQAAIVAKGPDGSSGFNWQHNPKFNPFSRSAAE